MNRDHPEYELLYDALYDWAQILRMRYAQAWLRYDELRMYHYLALTC